MVYPQFLQQHLALKFPVIPDKGTDRNTRRKLISQQIGEHPLHPGKSLVLIPGIKLIVVIIFNKPQDLGFK